MTHLIDAISRYHDLLEQDGFRDMAWAEELQLRMRARGLVESGRLLSPTIRPQFISRQQYERLTKTAERLASILDKFEQRVLQTPTLLNRLHMLPAEKMLATTPVKRHARISVAARLEVAVRNGSLSVSGYSSCKPRSFASCDVLAELFLDLPILKTFKARKYRLSKVGQARKSVACILQCWKNFGGRTKPHVAIVEIADGTNATGGEGQLFVELFREDGIDARLVPPEALEYSGGRLRSCGWEIDVVFRRILTSELLSRFDLSHPLLSAYRAGHVCVVNCFGSEVAQRRALLELLSDDSITAQLPSDDRKLIARVIPWTRFVSKRKTSYKDQLVDLPEFIRTHQQQLVLRPNDQTSGLRSFVGKQMTPFAWDLALRTAFATPYVVQDLAVRAEEPVPVFHYGELQMKNASVSIQSHLFGGRLRALSAELETANAGGSVPLALSPVFVLEEN